LKKVFSRIKSFLKQPKFISREETVGGDIYSEYLEREKRHVKLITEALHGAGYGITPILSSDIDGYGIARFNVLITWDRLDEIQKRIREGLPDRTIRQRLEEEGNAG